MPIVNLSNYVRCWSCNRAMHLPAYADPQTNGNRAFMCQECYERADAQLGKGSQTQAVKGECNKQTQKFADAAYSQAMTPLNGYVIVRCDQETGAKFVLPKIYQRLKFASSELALMEPAPGFAYCIATLGTPVARAKWEMPTKEEAEACHYAYFCHPAGQVDSMLVALEKFVALRNLKL